jgi:hypothetical protein
MGFDHRRQYLNTAPNIFSVFEHEFVAHGLMGLRQRVGSYDIHGEVYKFQVSTFNFRHYVTGDYKKLTLRRNEGYNRK